jgi:hypothetical protein
MDSPFEDAEQAVQRYVTAEGISVVECIGQGIDGTVWQSTRQSAIKSCYRHDAYERERDCYRRQFEHGVRTLAGFDVPELMNYRNDLQIIEMTIVFPPCILDFGKAYVDSQPEYSAEALAEAEEAEWELFTQEQWKQGRLVRAALLRYGIHYFDARPSNVMFPKELGGE